MMLVSTLGMLAGSGRGGGAKAGETNEDRKDYLRYLGQMRERARGAADDQRAALEWNHPDPQALWSMATSRRMWERRQNDPDFGQTWGLNNTGQTGGFENADISVSKTITLGAESRTLEFRAEAFNTLNHFNPSNPNTSLAINCNAVNGVCTPGGANTNAAFGQITSAALPARHAVVSVRFRF